MLYFIVPSFLQKICTEHLPNEICSLGGEGTQVPSFRGTQVETEGHLQVSVVMS